MVGGEDEIALVLAVLLVDEDDHAAGGQLGDELGDGSDGHGEIVGGGVDSGWPRGHAQHALDIAGDQVDLEVD